MKVAEKSDVLNDAAGVQNMAAKIAQESEAALERQTRELQERRTSSRLQKKVTTSGDHQEAAAAPKSILKKRTGAELDEQH